MWSSSHPRCAGQRCHADSLPDSRGPAFLVYYGPAFLQKAGLLDPFGAMQVLAELLRVARTMWPLKTSLSGVTVTVRIDALKAGPELPAGLGASLERPGWTETVV